MTATRHNAIELITRQKVVPVIRTPTRALAQAQCELLVEAGYRVLEVTLTVPDAEGLIAELAQDDRLCVGAGTVLSPDQARAAADVGAGFLVSPVAPDWFVQLGRALTLECVPGVATPSEAFAARASGARLIKVFPIARLGGAAFIRDLLAPMPELALMATGGVSATDAGELLDAGCVAVGLGSLLSDPVLGETQSERAAAALQLVGGSIA
ncbi:bifunctional 4-hydroxy-2-oxoglutarate aldolase/2-dehydro-3-deoxy-phosphogluconate aldolase [Subtercola boreus]|uniref:bifunctional 4-hydroxy-2-oxoglutarate aldolase/2-dehydro-3-deoxy-phosphogluconate aldolase n=1 Tax=Subtercola boreus TaxID=120213 RepID=UPI001559D0EC|nr:2-dehydro-3-deoxyphosphogluconate aldolase [Subtercola boreus]